MRAISRLLRYWPALLSAVAALSALALLIYVRDSPLQLAPFLRIDALSAFFWFDHRWAAWRSPWHPNITVERAYPGVYLFSPPYCWRPIQQR